MLANSIDSFSDETVWPPGFRFHPTEQELVLYYLKRKICHRKLRLDIIAEVDVYKWDPEELPGQSLLKTGDRQWFFFSPRDRKYPNGSRSNRATIHGYWKATGKDRHITCNSRTVGVKKTLVFYKGRAPKGERTDWVMHEYTMDEDELNRCQNVQDYYALYKVYKKSGPGPKNGEQYGAPFREEDWGREEEPEVRNNADQVNHVRQLDETVSSASCKVRAQPEARLSEIEEFMNRVVDDNSTEIPNVNDYVNSLAQVVSEEAAKSTMTDRSFGESSLAQQCVKHPPSNWLNQIPAGFTFTQSASQSEMYGAPQMTPVANFPDLKHHVAEDDYLEMDDLLGPEPAVYDVGNLIDPQSSAYEPLPNPQVEEAVGVSGLDLYYDAEMFLRELEPIDQLTIPPLPCINTQEITQVTELANAVDYPLQSYPDAMDSFLGSELWTYEQSSFVSNPAEMIPGSVSHPTQGVVYAGVSVSTNVPESNQNQNGKEADGADPWFTSALWSFIESIPTTPASAAESASVVNRALERVSSFSRIRINAKGTTSATNTSDIGIGGRMKGLFLFSLLGALFAFVCVLIGRNS
ncbi:hypothetical protein Ancab_038619 [Ancistrocladus abbreviatus]